MNNENEKLSNRLYLKFTFVLLVFFFIVLIFVVALMMIIMLTPIGRIAMQGIGSITIMFFLCSYVVITIISCFIIYFYLKKIFHPLVELSSKSMKVAKGDFSVSVKEEATIPELKDTLHNFNIMIQELSKVETLSNDFISNVSHEFKTPLSVIRSNVNILQSMSLDEEERKKCLEVIIDSTDKLSTLVSNVLKLCKLDNQDIKIEKSIFRLDEQIRQCILFYGDQLDSKNIELDLDLDDCYIESDMDLLNQVWSNILSNAIKFSHDNGVIKVSLKAGKIIVVTIEDNGDGMSEETIKHIFDRFYQGDSSHTREGNGLGLTIVGKILRLCRGSINVESQINRGSKFVVQLPLKINN